VLEPFVKACVGKWGSMRKPRESDFQVGFIIPIKVWTQAEKALGEKK
jgi:hypothetical protein